LEYFVIRTTYRIYIFTKLNIFPKECALRCNEHLGIASTNMSTSLETEIVTFDYLRGYMSSLYGLRARAIGLYEQTWYGIYE